MQEEKPKKEKKNKTNNEAVKAGKRTRKDEELTNSQFEPLNMKKIKIEGTTKFLHIHFVANQSFRGNTE